MSTRVFESWVEYLANARSMRAPMVLGGDAPARVSGLRSNAKSYHLSAVSRQGCRHCKCFERRCGHMFLVVVLQSMQRCRALEPTATAEFQCHVRCCAMCPILLCSPAQLRHHADATATEAATPLWKRCHQPLPEWCRTCTEGATHLKSCTCSSMHDGTQVVELLLSPPPQRTHD